MAAGDDEVEYYTASSVIDVLTNHPELSVDYTDPVFPFPVPACPKPNDPDSHCRKDFPECLNCKDRGFCALCMARNGNEDPNGNIFHINKHFCEVAAINHKIAMEWREKHIAKKNNR